MDDRDPLSVDAVRGAVLLGISERAFHELRKRPDFPRPVALFGPRRPRWRTADLYKWLTTLPTIDSNEREPARLARGRKSALAAKQR